MRVDVLLGLVIAAALLVSGPALAVHAERAPRGPPLAPQGTTPVAVDCGAETGLPSFENFSIVRFGERRRGPDVMVVSATLVNPTCVPIDIDAFAFALRGPQRERITVSGSDIHVGPESTSVITMNLSRDSRSRSIAREIGERFEFGERGLQLATPVTYLGSGRFIASASPNVTHTTTFNLTIEPDDGVRAVLSNVVIDGLPIVTGTNVARSVINDALTLGARRV